MADRDPIFSVDKNGQRHFSQMAWINKRPTTGTIWKPPSKPRMAPDSSKGSAPATSTPKRLATRGTGQAGTQRAAEQVQASLVPGGRAAIVEFVPNPDRITPPTAAAFSMIMLATTPWGDAYTFAELESMTKEAGFAMVESAQSLGMNSLIVAYE
jgi:hypothetical protein